ncbi:LOW QUALITY PROTEIN: uncharacterized protein LOC104862662 [Fukomys damarensis]|uniref:LOW QUALITY PROTEIN: uncharacterized protein LOC104862662 n=1 Tax=Fukomys damarensis TaxID=885580 RepID=UPI0005403185|nr:LOW QUALITY PROTEIN: uncharacterized protein LOC104862662 [Fukomys damarensis]
MGKQRAFVDRFASATCKEEKGMNLKALHKAAFTRSCTRLCRKKLHCLQLRLGDWDSGRCRAGPYYTASCLCLKPRTVSTQVGMQQMPMNAWKAAFAIKGGLSSQRSNSDCKRLWSQARVEIDIFYAFLKLLESFFQAAGASAVQRTVSRRRVCEKCEKKLGTVITSHTWKDGARNSTENGGRKLNENKAWTSKKTRFHPCGKNEFSTFRICRSSVHQPGSHYCQGCSYKKGICAMCGEKKVLDPKNYKQTSV